MQYDIVNIFHIKCNYCTYMYLLRVTIKYYSSNINRNIFNKNLMTAKQWDLLNLPVNISKVLLKRLKHNIIAVTLYVNA